MRRLAAPSKKRDRQTRSPATPGTPGGPSSGNTPGSSKRPPPKRLHGLPEVLAANSSLQQALLGGGLQVPGPSSAGGGSSVYTESEAPESEDSEEPDSEPDTAGPSDAEVLQAQYVAARRLAIWRNVASSKHPPQLVLGPYHWHPTPLGNGATATVYAARHKDEQTPEWVLKVITEREPSTLTSVMRETMIMLLLQENWKQHQSSVECQGLFQWQDNPDVPVTHALVLGRAQHSLLDRIEKGPIAGESFQLDPLVVLKTITQTLIMGRRMGAVHRDLKPDNIFVTPKPVSSHACKQSWGISVGDYGLAALCRDGMMDYENMAGTDKYWAPEMLRDHYDPRFEKEWTNQKEYDAHRGDVWALGVIFHELLTGRYPFPNHDKIRKKNWCPWYFGIGSQWNLDLIDQRGAEQHAEYRWFRPTHDDNNQPILTNQVHIFLLGMMLEPDVKKRCTARELWDAIEKYWDGAKHTHPKTLSPDGAWPTTDLWKLPKESRAKLEAQVNMLFPCAKWKDVKRALFRPKFKPPKEDRKYFELLNRVGNGVRHLGKHIKEKLGDDWEAFEPKGDEQSWEGAPRIWKRTMLVPRE